MRKLFMIIFIPILVLAGTPAILAVIMYDGAGYDEMPNHLYTEDADAEKMLYQELSDSLDELESGANADMEFNLHEDIINVAIYQAMVGENPLYAPSDDCETPDECYFKYVELPIQEGSELRIVGAWVEFEQNKFILNVFIDVQITESIAYKTVIETHFKLEDHPGQGKYTLQFEKIRIGNLPIPSGLISTILNAVESNFDGFELDGISDDLPIGQFDLDSFTYTIEKQEIVDMIGETDDGVELDDNTKMLQEIASIVFEQGLLEFDLVDEELILAARISKFASEDVIEIPDYLYDLHVVTGYDIDNNPIYGEYDPEAFDPVAYMQNVFTEFVFNNALIGGGFEITDELFNKVIYSGAGGFAEMTESQELELPDGTIREVEVGLQAVWFTIEEDAIYANALFKLDSTMSLMKLKATKVEEESSATVLVFDFTELSFGADAGETAVDYVSVTNLEVFESYLVGIDDIQFGSIEETTNGVYLTITSEALTSLLTEGTEDETVAINGISLVHGAIVLDVVAADPALQAVLDDLQDAVSAVLEDEALITNLNDALNPDNDNEEAQDVIDAVTSIQDILVDPEDDIEAEDLEVLFDEFEDLDAEDQEAFLSEIGDLIPADIMENFTAMFGDDVLPTTEIPTP